MEEIEAVHANLDSPHRSSPQGCFGHPSWYRRFGPLRGGQREGIRPPPFWSLAAALLAAKQLTQHELEEDHHDSLP